MTRPTCICAHSADLHDHYRVGKDCGACDCPGYQRPRVPVLDRLRLLLRRTRLA